MAPRRRRLFPSPLLFYTIVDGSIRLRLPRAVEACWGFVGAGASTGLERERVHGDATNTPLIGRLYPCPSASAPAHA
jgi:hypothetical protein